MVKTVKTLYLISALFLFMMIGFYRANAIADRQERRYHDNPNIVQLDRIMAAAGSYSEPLIQPEDPYLKAGALRLNARR